MSILQQPARLAVYIPHLRQGGGELSMLRLAQGLAQRGLQVDLIVHRLAGAELQPPPGLGLVELGHQGTLGSLRALATLLRRTRPRWLLSAFPHTNVAAVAATAMAARSGPRTLCLLSEHAPLALQIRRQGGWRYRVLPPLVRWAYPRADAVVAVSTGVQQDLLGLVGESLRPRLQVIANPVLDARPAATPLDTPLHPWLLDPGLRVVLSVSRLSEEKDIPTLLRAFALLVRQVPQARLLLAGDGPQRAQLQALVEQLGLAGQAQLVGRVQGPQAWMQRAAVFALASQYEGFGNVLVEALASACPVVATDCPVGPREILEGGRWGTLVPVGAHDALAQALQSIICKPPAAAALQAAAAHAARFTDEAACAAWRELLERLARC